MGKRNRSETQGHYSRRQGNSRPHTMSTRQHKSCNPLPLERESRTRRDWQESWCAELWPSQQKTPLPVKKYRKPESTRREQVSPEWRRISLCGALGLGYVCCPRCVGCVCMFSYLLRGFSKGVQAFPNCEVHTSARIWIGIPLRIFGRSF